MKKEYLSPAMVVIPIIEELSILETASGNLPPKSQGHNMDDEEEEYEYETETTTTPSGQAKYTPNFFE